jgi:hypothetical protein
MKSTQLKDSTPINSNRSPFFQKENGNKPFFDSTFIQAKLTVNQANDPYEKEADTMADKVVQRAEIPSADGITSDNANNLSVQRECATCENEKEKIQKKETDAAADTAITSPKTITTSPNVTAARFIVDDSVTPAAGQMCKTDFLNRLKVEICMTVNQALAGTPFSSDNCPYIRAAFARHQGSSPLQMEQLIARYEPSTAQAQSVDDLIQRMKVKVFGAAKQWSATGGDLSGVTPVFGGITSGISSAVGGIASSIGGLFFKSNEGGANATQSPQAIMQGLGRGQPLDSKSKGKMESAFGTSFSSVEVHKDSNAASLSDNMNARAFTVGNHIAFGSGEHKPGTLVGDALLAHELAHVVQQKNKGAAKNNSETDLESDVDYSISQSISESVNIKKISPKLKSGLRVSRCSKPAKKSLLDQFAEKFPDSADLVKNSPSALALVKEASDAGVEFGGYSEEGPGKWAWPYTSGNTVYVPKSHKGDKVTAASDFLFELNNAIRQPKFAAINAEGAKGSKGTLDAKAYARKNVELEVEGMLRTGEVWFEMKKNAPKGENWNKYDSDFFLQQYEDYKAGRKTKDDIINSVLGGVYPEGVNKGKTVEQYYMEQYKKISGGK